MQKRKLLLQPDVIREDVSDRQLGVRIHQRETAALGLVYDRYAPLVFTLLCHGNSAVAESLLEDVFVALWHHGSTMIITDLVSTLLRLTAEALTPRTAAKSWMQGTAWGQAELPPLMPFRSLPPHAFDVMVLTWIGKLTINEVSVALERDAAELYRALATGFAMVRRSATPVQIEHA